MIEVSREDPVGSQDRGGGRGVRQRASFARVAHRMRHRTEKALHQSSLERFAVTFRAGLFGLTYSLSKSHEKERWSEVFALALAGFQMLSFPLNSSQLMPWNDVASVGKFSGGLDYVTTDRMDQTHGPSVLRIFLVVAMSWTAIFLGLALFVAVSFAKDLPQNALVLRSLRHIARLSTSYLFLPFTAILFRTLACPSDYDGWMDTGWACGSSERVVIAVFAAVLLAAFAFLALFVAATFVDRNPSSESWSARSHGRVDVAMLSMKLFLGFLFNVVDESVMGGAFVTIVLIAVGVVWMGLLLRYMPFVHPHINAMETGFGAAFLWSSLALALAQLSDQESLTHFAAFFVYLGAPLAFTLGFCLCLLRERAIAEKDPEDLSSPHEIEVWARAKLRHWRKLADRENGAGATPLRLGECASANGAYANDKGARGGCPVMGSSLAEDKVTSPSMRLLEEAEAVYRGAYDRFPHDSTLFLFAACFFREHSSLNFDEAIALSRAKKLDPALDAQYHIYERTRQLREADNSGMSTVDRILFDQQVKEAKALRIEAFRQLVVVWETLGHTNPDSVRLQAAGVALLRHLTRIEGLYAGLLRTSPNSTAVLRAYATFLMELANEPVRAMEMLNKADRIEEANSKQRNRIMRHITFGVSTETQDLMDERSPIITISGDPSTLGEIVGVSTAACRTFGYASTQLVGQNINLIVPPPFRAAHNSFLHRFAKTGRANLVNRSRLLFGTSKTGVIFPMWTQVTEAPPEEETCAPRFTAIMTPVVTSENHLFFGLKETGFRLHAATAGSLSLLGLDAERVETNNISLLPWFPSLSPSFHTRTQHFSGSQAAALRTIPSASDLLGGEAAAPHGAAHSARAMRAAPSFRLAMGASFVGTLDNPELTRDLAVPVNPLLDARTTSLIPVRNAADDTEFILGSVQVIHVRGLDPVGLLRWHPLPHSSALSARIVPKKGGVIAKVDEDEDEDEEGDGEGDEDSIGVVGDADHTAIDVGHEDEDEDDNDEHDEDNDNTAPPSRGGGAAAASSSASSSGRPDSASGSKKGGSRSSWGAACAAETSGGSSGLCPSDDPRSGPSRESRDLLSPHEPTREFRPAPSSDPDSAPFLSTDGPLLTPPGAGARSRSPAQGFVPSAASAATYAPSALSVPAPLNLSKSLGSPVGDDRRPPPFKVRAKQSSKVSPAEGHHAAIDSSSELPSPSPSPSPARTPGPAGGGWIGGGGSVNSSGSKMTTQLKRTLMTLRHSTEPDVIVARKMVLALVLAVFALLIGAILYVENLQVVSEEVMEGMWSVGQRLVLFQFGFTTMREIIGRNLGLMVFAEANVTAQLLLSAAEELGEHNTLLVRAGMAGGPKSYTYDTEAPIYIAELAPDMSTWRNFTMNVVEVVEMASSAYTRLARGNLSEVTNAHPDVISFKANVERVRFALNETYLWQTTDMRDTIDRAQLTLYIGGAVFFVLAIMLSTFVFVRVMNNLSQRVRNISNPLLQIPTGHARLLQRRWVVNLQRAVNEGEEEDTTDDDVDMTAEPHGDDSEDEDKPLLMRPRAESRAAAGGSPVRAPMRLSIATGRRLSDAGTRSQAPARGSVAVNVGGASAPGATSAVLSANVAGGSASGALPAANGAASSSSSSSSSSSAASRPRRAFQETRRNFVRGLTLLTLPVFAILAWLVFLVVQSTALRNRLYDTVDRVTMVQQTNALMLDYLNSMMDVISMPTRAKRDAAIAYVLELDRQMVQATRLVVYGGRLDFRMGDASVDISALAMDSRIDGLIHADACVSDDVEAICEALEGGVMTKGVVSGLMTMMGMGRKLVSDAAQETRDVTLMDEAHMAQFSQVHQLIRPHIRRALTRSSELLFEEAEEMVAELAVVMTTVSIVFVVAYMIFSFAYYWPMIDDLATPIRSAHGLLTVVPEETIHAIPELKLALRDVISQSQLGAGKDAGPAGA